MFVFNMPTKHDFASFKDNKTNSMVFVESFDNTEFTVLFGTPSVQVNLGNVIAGSDEILNQKLQELVSGAKGKD